MNNEIVIELKNRRNWLLIVLFAVPTFQLILGTFFILLNFNDIALRQSMTLLGMYAVFFYFLVKGLIWQLKGVRQIKILGHELTLTKYSPVTNKSRKYDLNRIKGFNVVDRTVKEGPLAMLQILGIADKMFLTFEYEGRTVKTISGNNFDELQIIKNKIDLGLG